MVVVGVSQKNIVQTASAQSGVQLAYKGFSREAEAGIVEDGGVAVIQEKGTVAGQGAQVGDGEVCHGKHSILLACDAIIADYGRKSDMLRKIKKMYFCMQGGESHPALHEIFDRICGDTPPGQCQ